MKEFLKILVFYLLLFATSFTYGQLGFCSGSKGDPVFKENFGSGLNYGPQLPLGTTNYTYVAGGFPQDGQYTLNYRTNLIPNSQNWHFSLDHTPDNEVDGTNGKSLVVNASFTTGEFFKKTVTGLCINTTFEFSAWIMNIYNSASGGCPGTGIPINIRFEIWNDTETILLQSGNTGDIPGTPTPIWRQYGLVFTTTNQTSVVLKMKNNGVGGCGNDLAIDDIMFRSCGDLTLITSPSAIGNTYSTCPENTPLNLTLQASTSGTATYFYQWQESTDNINWVDIPGENSPNYSASGITSQRYYRTKVAQDLANLNNNFCSTLSNIFTVSFLTAPSAPSNDGNQIICAGQTIPALSVTAGANLSVNWYDSPTNGNLLLSNSPTYTPTAAGTFYAETVSSINNCRSSTRTPVTLTLTPLPTATISGTTAVCSGSNATITINGTPNATVIYSINGGANQTAILSAGGSTILSVSNVITNTTYTIVRVIAPGTAGCTATPSSSATISVTPPPTASISGTTTICSGNNATLTINGTPNATVLYSINGGANQTQLLNAGGSASIVASNVTANATYTIVSVIAPGAAGCSATPTSAATISVTLSPTASISGTTTICSGNNATLTINGTPNATVLYSINGGANQTQLLNASGSATIVASNVTANTTYTIVRVIASGTAGCFATPTSAATISVTLSPTASISGTTTICSGNNATLTINGTPNATVLYSINGGANQTQLLNASGSASIVASNVTINTTYTIVRVIAPGTAGCSATPTSAATINVTSSPTASISGTTAICSGNNATLTINGTPNATVLYSINGGANQTQLLNASGSASIIASNVTTNTTYTLVRVIAPGTAGCSATPTSSATINVTLSPTASISGTTTICSGGNATLTINGTPNATVLYSINGGVNQTQILNAGGSATIVASNITANTTYTIVRVIAPGTAGCSATPTSSATISVTLSPTASISGTTAICSGSNVTLTFNGTANATVLYSINGGPNQTQLLNSSGSASIVASNVTVNTTYALVRVIASGIGGCSATPSSSVTISVTPPLTATISGTTTLCSGSNATIRINGTPTTIVNYTINGGIAQSILLDASGNASLVATNITSNTTYTLVSVSSPTGSSCLQTLSQSATIIVKPTPVANFSGVTSYCSGETTAIALTSGFPGTTFSWTATQNGVTGAFDDSGNAIAQTVSTIQNIGNITYTVIPTLNGCSGLPLIIPVTVNPLPIPTITDGIICRDNITNLVTQPYVLYTNLSATTHTFDWYFNTGLLPSATGNTLSVSDAGVYGVIATNTVTGCVSQLAVATVSELLQAQSLTVSQTNAFSEPSIVTVTVNGGGGPYLYQMDDGPFQSSNVFTNVPFGSHVINVINSDGCTNLTTTVTVINYPHYFTPNDDGINDTWNINGVNANARIYIFDRYGKLLKQISTLGEGWDGTYNGRKLFADDYWFTITYIEAGAEKTFRAHFSLKR